MDRTAANDIATLTYQIKDAKQDIADLKVEKPCGFRADVHFLQIDIADFEAELAALTGAPDAAEKYAAADAASPKLDGIHSGDRSYTFSL